MAYLSHIVADRQALTAAAAATTAAVTLGLLLPPAVRSYQGFLALGPGGVPYNLVGWAIQGIAGLFAIDPLDVDAVDHPPPHIRHHYGDAGQQSYWPADEGPLPARRPPVPDIPAYTIPQRQMSDGPPDPVATREAMVAFLEALAAANPAALTVQPSHLEGVGTPALHGPAGAGARSEIVHVHHEASAHLCLSLADCAQAMRQGWGQRHPLSGVRGFGLPAGYLFVYAPRDDGERAVWRRLVVAAATFAVGGQQAIVRPQDEKQED